MKEKLTTSNQTSARRLTELQGRVAEQAAGLTQANGALQQAQVNFLKVLKQVSMMLANKQLRSIYVDRLHSCC